MVEILLPWFPEVNQKIKTKEQHFIMALIRIYTPLEYLHETNAI